MRRTRSWALGGTKLHREEALALCLLLTPVLTPSLPPQSSSERECPGAEELLAAEPEGQAQLSSCSHLRRVALPQRVGAGLR